MEHQAFFDNLDAFIRLERSRLFTASVQATYFAILREFYLQGFPKEITMSVRELGERAGLKSSETVHVAKNILKNNGLINFQTVGKRARRTVFSLVCPNVYPNVCPNNSPNNLPNSENGLGLISCTQNAETSAAAPLPLPPTPPIPNPNNNSMNNQAGVAEQAKQGAGAGADVDVVELWKEMTGQPLKSPSDQFALRHYDDTYGREIVKVAIEEHVYGKGRTFKFFKICLDSLLAKLRGGEQDGRDDREVRVDRQSGGRDGGRSGRSIQSFAQTASGRDDEELPDDTDYERIYADIAAIQNSDSSD